MAVSSKANKKANKRIFIQKFLNNSKCYKCHSVSGLHFCTINSDKIVDIGADQSYLKIKRKFLTYRVICESCSSSSHNRGESFPRKISSKRRKREAIKKYRLVIGCQKCKTKKELTFHHRDPSQKSFNFHCAIKDGRSWEDIIQELAKCDVLCDTCHRAVHNNIDKKFDIKNITVKHFGPIILFLALLTGFYFLVR